MRRAVIQFSHRLYLQKIKQWNYRQHCYPLKGVVKYAFAFFNAGSVASSSVGVSIIQRLFPIYAV